MAKRNLGEKIKLSTYDEMFGTDTFGHDDQKTEGQIINIPLSELHTFKDHEREIQKSKEKTLFATNETAVMKVQELRENGAEIIRITEKEVDAIARVFKSGQKLTSVKLTEEQIKRINENYQKYQTKQALDRTLDLSVYLEGLDDSPESKQIAQARGICAQTLRTAGYSFLQINLLHPFIMQNKTADEIMKIFSKDATREEIENLSKIFG